MFQFVFSSVGSAVRVALTVPQETVLEIDLWDKLNTRDVPCLMFLFIKFENIRIFGDNLKKKSL